MGQGMEQLLAIYHFLLPKKWKTIDRANVSVKRGGTTAFLYENLMVASQGFCMNLNKYMLPDLDPDVAKDVESMYWSASIPTLSSVRVLLMALFQVAKHNYANEKHKSESPNACYSPLRGIRHAGHITRGWDL